MRSEGARSFEEELGSKEGMANAYGNLGIIYQTRGDLDRAEDMQLKALKLIRGAGQQAGHGQRLSRPRQHLPNTGRSRSCRGDAARKHSSSTRRLGSKLRAWPLQPMAISALIYQSAGRSGPRRGHAAESAQTFRGSWAANRGMANAYGNLGLIYKTRRDLDRAEDMQLQSAQTSGKS